MKCILLIVLIGGVSSFGENEVLGREQEAENMRELRPFKMPAMIRHICESMRGVLEEQEYDSRPRNAEQLSATFVALFDDNEDGCISGNEIRNIAARFRGLLAGYRMVFERVLDENQNGCVEPQELNALVLDCIMPSSSWLRGMPSDGIDRYSLPFSAEEKERVLAETEPVLDNTIEDEEESEDEILNEEWSQEEEDLGRRELMEAEKETIKELHPAIKETICSMIKQQHEDAEFGVKLLAEIVEADEEEGLSQNELYEFLTAARVPREESDDLFLIIDTDNDGVVTVEELMISIDNCPAREGRPEHPITGYKPRIYAPEISCPTIADLYKQLRIRAMKYVGRTAVELVGAQQAAADLYIEITGDVEETIEPADLDVPLECVKESWTRSIDANQDGFLDLFEFSRMALDVLEEFIPRREKKDRRLNVPKMSGEQLVHLETIPKNSMEILTKMILRIGKEGGMRVPESDLETIAGMLLQDRNIAAFLDKIGTQSHAGEDAFNVLNRMMRPVLHQILSQRN